MTETELKKMLQDYNRTCHRIKRYQERLKEIEELVSTVQDLKAVTYTGMPGNPSNKSDPTYRSVERVLVKYDEESKDLRERVHELKNQTELMDKMMRGLKYNECKVICLKYVEGWRWDQVVAAVPYCRSHCFRIEREAIKKMIRIFKRI